MLGVAVGDAVGESVGDAVGDAVGESAGAAVGDAVVFGVATGTIGSHILLVHVLDMQLCVTVLLSQHKDGRLPHVAATGT